MKKHNLPRQKPLILVLDFLIVIMAVSGLYLILQPIYIHWQQDRLTQQLQDAFDQGDGTILIDSVGLEVNGEDEEYADVMESLTTTADTETTGSGQEPVTTESEATAEPTPAPTAAKVVVTAIGRIKIPSISVNMPIAEGSTKYNLRVAIGHYSNSAGLGQPGNSIFLGHRMYTYGRHFNRLGEVQIGDQIIIEDKKYRYTYIVDQIDTILPDQLVYALNEKAEGSRIMLVTCTPVRVASHRLLVKGALVATEPLG